MHKIQQKYSISWRVVWREI